MATLGFRHVDNGMHGRVSVGTATLQSIAGIVIYFYGYHYLYRRLFS